MTAMVLTKKNAPKYTKGQTVTITRSTDQKQATGTILLSDDDIVSVRTGKRGRPFTLHRSLVSAITVVETAAAAPKPAPKPKPPVAPVEAPVEGDLVTV